MIDHKKAVSGLLESIADEMIKVNAEIIELDVESDTYEIELKPLLRIRRTLHHVMSHLYRAKEQILCDEVDE